MLRNDGWREIGLGGAAQALTLRTLSHSAHSAQSAHSDRAFRAALEAGLLTWSQHLFLQLGRCHRGRALLPVDQLTNHSLYFGRQFGLGWITVMLHDHPPGVGMGYVGPKTVPNPASNQRKTPPAVRSASGVESACYAVDGNVGQCLSIRGTSVRPRKLGSFL
jgi:hypothetical protein